jgi:hypothetical protein
MDPSSTTNETNKTDVGSDFLPSERTTDPPPPCPATEPVLPEDVEPEPDDEEPGEENAHDGKSVRRELLLSGG